MALCYSNSSLNPFTPELPVSPRADPRSFYHLWRHQFYWSRTTLSVSVCRVKRSFKPIPEWAQFSQGYRRKRQKNMWDWPENCHENLVPLPAYLSFHLTLRSLPEIVDISRPWSIVSGISFLKWRTKTIVVMESVSLAIFWIMWALWICFTKKKAGIKHLARKC